MLIMGKWSHEGCLLKEANVWCCPVSQTSRLPCRLLPSAKVPFAKRAISGVRMASFLKTHFLCGRGGREEAKDCYSISTELYHGKVPPWLTSPHCQLPSTVHCVIRRHSVFLPVTGILDSIPSLSFSSFLFACMCSTEYSTTPHSCIIPLFLPNTFLCLLLSHHAILRQLKSRSQASQTEPKPVKPSATSLDNLS